MEFDRLPPAPHLCAQRKTTAILCGLPHRYILYNFDFFYRMCNMQHRVASCVVLPKCVSVCVRACAVIQLGIIYKSKHATRESAHCGRRCRRLLLFLGSLQAARVFDVVLRVICPSGKIQFRTRCGLHNNFAALTRARSGQRRRVLRHFSLH